MSIELFQVIVVAFGLGAITGMWLSGRIYMTCRRGRRHQLWIWLVYRP